MSNSFLIDLLIAVLVYFLFGVVIDTLVKDSKAHDVLRIILLIVCVFYALFGTFLPFR